ncbi:DUF72 domain-containing protein [Cupriavidus basilensis]
MRPHHRHNRTPPTAALRATAGKPARGKSVLPARLDPAIDALRKRLPSNLYLGTSSWSYNGWNGLVYDGEYSDSLLSRRGPCRVCAASAAARAAGIDRGFYGPIPLADYLSYAAQVPEQFRFPVKAPASVCDAWLRGSDGVGRLANAAFLDAEIASRDFITPATSGLGIKCGALLFQLSPLGNLANDGTAFLERLDGFLSALPPLDPSITPHACYAVEMRDPVLLTPRYIKLLPQAWRTLSPVGARPAAAGAPPGFGPGADGCRSTRPARTAMDAPCRPALRGRGIDLFPVQPPGGRGPGNARCHPPISSCARCARGESATVIISNKAEGSAPLTCVRLAEAIAARLSSRTDGTPHATSDAASDAACRRTSRGTWRAWAR